jgi:hypothetical protein
MVLRPSVRTLDLLYVAPKPSVAAFTDVVPTLGGTQVRTQMRRPSGLAVGYQARLPVGGLLMAVGTVR